MHGPPALRFSLQRDVCECVRRPAMIRVRIYGFQFPGDADRQSALFSFPFLSFSLPSPGGRWFSFPLLSPLLSFPFLSFPSLPVPVPGGRWFPFLSFFVLFCSLPVVDFSESIYLFHFIFSSKERKERKNSLAAHSTPIHLLVWTPLLSWLACHRLASPCHFLHERKNTHRCVDTTTCSFLFTGLI